MLLLSFKNVYDYSLCLYYLRLVLVTLNLNYKMKKYMVTCRSGFLKICSEVMRLFKLIKKADELKVLFDSL